MKKIILTLLVLVTLMGILVGCDGSQNGVTNGNVAINKDEYTEIKFSDMYETKGTEKNVSKMLQDLAGKKVSIKGYPAVQSPLDESFVYLNNQPYVTCPFCTIGDITKLEVIPIFMANGSQIKYTENSLNVYGTLEIEPKVDSEGYTTQFRIYADSVETVEDSDVNKAVQTYYANLSEAGMIYDLQTLQMNIEYASNPDYMSYYGENYKDALKAIVDEYIGFDKQYSELGSGYTYLVYIKECPGIVKSCEPEDERLKSLNDELIELYKDQIILMQKYQDLAYKYYNKTLSEEESKTAYDEFCALNSTNLDLYNKFTSWNNRLRESD